MNIKKLSLLLLSITLLNTVYCAEKKHAASGLDPAFKSDSDDELDLFDAELADISTQAKEADDILRSVSRGLSSISLSDGEKTPSQVMEEKRSGRHSGGTTSVLHFEKQANRRAIQQRSAEIHKARQAKKMQEDWRRTPPIQRKRSSSTPLDTEHKKAAPESSVTSPRFTPNLSPYIEEEAAMLVEERKDT